jgi:tetratricopeptide (TPR) repeat protein
MAEYFARNYDRAVQLLQQALELYQAVGQPLGMAHAYNNLARAQQFAGADRASADNLEAARELYGELGNSLGVINVLIRLGAVLRQSDRDRAVRILNEAITKSVGIGNQLARIDALDALGEIYINDGETDAAVSMWSQALQIAREHGVQREEAKLSVKISNVR